MLSGWNDLVEWNIVIRCSVKFGQMKRKCSASSVSCYRLHKGEGLRWLLNKSLFKLLHLFLILACNTDMYLSPVR